VSGNILQISFPSPCPSTQGSNQRHTSRTLKSPSCCYLPYLEKPAKQVYRRALQQPPRTHPPIPAAVNFELLQLPRGSAPPPPLPARAPPRVSPPASPLPGSPRRRWVPPATARLPAWLFLRGSCGWVFRLPLGASGGKVLPPPGFGSTALGCLSAMPSWSGEDC
jgi:hypothetical protein